MVIDIQKNVMEYWLLLLKIYFACISEAYVNTGDYLINGHFLREIINKHIALCMITV